MWPVLGVLFLDAFVAERHKPRWPAWVGAALAAMIAPFAYYYELWGRLSAQLGTWNYRFQGNLSNINEYVVPAVVVLAAAALLAQRWKNLPAPERRLVAIAFATIVALSLWVPTAAPAAFLRYVVVAAPLDCLLAAWVLVRALGSQAPRFAWLGAAMLAMTPWPSLPLRAFIPPSPWAKTDSVFRSELSVLGSEVFGHRPDPNRIVIDWLKQNAAPGDGILINYEDAPLMFYLPNPIRGGIAAFRAEDDAKTPPRFAVMRRSVGFVHWPVFQRELQRYHWVQVPLKAPDLVWGNNPDPIARPKDPAKARDIIILRRVE